MILENEGKSGRGSANQHMNGSSHSLPRDSIIQKDPHPEEKKKSYDSYLQHHHVVKGKSADVREEWSLSHRQSKKWVTRKERINEGTWDARQSTVGGRTDRGEEDEQT